MTVTTSTRTAPRETQLARLGLAAGIVGAGVFVVVDLVDALLRPDYSVLRHWVSHRALGDWGWVGVASLVVTALLLLVHGATTWTLPREARNPSAYSVALVVAGAALLVAALFRVDPSLGYPPGVAEPAATTFAGRVHGVAGPVFMLALAASALFSEPFLKRLGEPPEWARYSWAAALAVVALLVLTAVVAAADLSGAQWARWSGAAQRVACYVGLCWMAAVAARTMRSTAG